MKTKTAYVVEGHVILVPGKDDACRAAERIVEMIKFAITPSQDSIYIHQDAPDAFRTGNWDAEQQRGIKSWRAELPREVTTVYETALRYRPLNLSEEPNIVAHHRNAGDQDWAVHRIYKLSGLLREHGQDLGHGKASPIAQIQVGDYMHLCIHEDHLPEMLVYAEDKADKKLAELLGAAMSARQSEASKEMMRGLRDVFLGDRRSMAA